MDSETMIENEDQQTDRPPAVGTYDTNPFLTDQQKRAEQERAENEQDAETDDGDE